MIDKFKIEKFFVPSEGSNTGSVPIKFVIENETGKVFVGIGEDDWVIKNGISIDDISKLRIGV